MKTILMVIGTRPEAIKLAPVERVLREETQLVNKICVTNQHADLLDPILNGWGILTDYHFEQSERGSTLHRSAAHMLQQFDPIFRKSKPDLVIVQGDTTTAFIASLAAYYACVPVAHIEAGLRTGKLYSPWPEEGHRSLIGRLATYHFAATCDAKESLISEGISPDQVWIVGNTSIDALRLARKSPERQISLEQTIVVTAHRRENGGKPLRNICDALRQLHEEYPALAIKFLMHPNPVMRQTVEACLSGIRQIELIEPLNHSSFIALLEHCTFILTDSGGIQEEAPYLGKPVLILRDTTERPEGVLAGTSLLVGTDVDTIVLRCKELLDNPEKLAAMSHVHHPYGDGFAALRIVSVICEQLGVRVSNDAVNSPVC